MKLIGTDGNLLGTGRNYRNLGELRAEGPLWVDKNFSFSSFSSYEFLPVPIFEGDDKSCNLRNL